MDWPCAGMLAGGEALEQMGVPHLATGCEIDDGLKSIGRQLYGPPGWGGCTGHLLYGEDEGDLLRTTQKKEPRKGDSSTTYSLDWHIRRRRSLIIFQNGLAQANGVHSTFYCLKS